MSYQDQLIAALDFYATRSNWQALSLNEQYIPESSVKRDGGNLAREVLMSRFASAPIIEQIKKQLDGTNDYSIGNIRKIAERLSVSPLCVLQIKRLYKFSALSDSDLIRNRPPGRLI